MLDLEIPDNWQNFYKERSDLAKNLHLKDFYQAGIIDETTPLKNVEFVALDFETTGLEASVDDIVSIGLVPFTLKGIQCSKAKHWIVRPKPPLEEDSVVIHHITHSDISDAQIYSVFWKMC